MQHSDIGANQCHAALRSPMRGSLINKAEKLRIAIGRVRLGTGCSFFPLFYQAENFYCRFGDGGDLTSAPPSWRTRHQIESPPPVMPALIAGIHVTPTLPSPASGGG